MTLSGVGPELAAPRRAGRWFRNVAAGFPADTATNTVLSILFYALKAARPSAISFWRAQHLDVGGSR